MDSMTFALGFSKSLAVFIVLSYGVALWGVWASCPWVFALFLTVGLLYMGWQTWAKHCLRSQRHAVVAIWQDAMGRWGLIFKDGRSSPATLSPQTFKHPYLLVLAFKTPTSLRFIPIPRDALEPFAFRTLSTQLF